MPQTVHGDKWLDYADMQLAIEFFLMRRWIDSEQAGELSARIIGDKLAQKPFNISKGVHWHATKYPEGRGLNDWSNG